MIKCKVCNKMVKRLYGAHLNSHNMTSKEYLHLYPGSPLTTKEDLAKTSKNAGKHMKQQKYRDWAKQRMLGDKNHNHKSNTTLKQRQEKSPFSKEFWKNKTEESDACVLQQMVSSFAKEAVKDRLIPSNKQYWIDKGYNSNQTEQLVKQRQTTFSLEKCIQNTVKKKELKDGYKGRKNGKTQSLKMVS